MGLGGSGVVRHFGDHLKHLPKIMLLVFAYFLTFIKMNIFLLTVF